MSHPTPPGPTGEPGGGVTVVGSANVDLVVRVERRPGAGETVLGGDLAVLPGGKGANQAVAAARLGAPVRFVGRVGDDAHGTLLRDSLSGAGVELGGLACGPAPTGTALILVTPDGDNSIVVSPGANATVTRGDVQGPAVSDAGVLVLQREIDPAVSQAAAERARGLVLLNLAPSGPVPASLLQRVDVLVVNEHEAEDLLAGLTGPPEVVASRLRELGPRAVVLTLGEFGAVAADQAGTCTVPATQVEVVDTTGAGDALTGALAWRLASGDPLPVALRTAVLVGSLAVTRPGAQPSFPRLTDLIGAGWQPPAQRLA